MGFELLVSPIKHSNFMKFGKIYSNHIKQIRLLLNHKLGAMWAMSDKNLNVEITRNTKENLSFYEGMGDVMQSSGLTHNELIWDFPVFASRQKITCFLERYELYKKSYKLHSNTGWFRFSIIHGRYLVTLNLIWKKITH